MERLSFVYSLVFVILTQCDGTIDSRSLQGKWEVFETGYSPGSGYVVEQVPDSVDRIFEFGDSEEFSSNYNGFEDFNSYRLEYDSAFHTRTVTFFVRNSDEITPRSYFVELKDDALELRYKFCIEGCHIALKKVEH